MRVFAGAVASVAMVLAAFGSPVAARRAELLQAGGSTATRGRAHGAAAPAQLLHDRGTGGNVGVRIGDDGVVVDGLGVHRKRRSGGGRDRGDVAHPSLHDQHRPQRRSRRQQHHRVACTRNLVTGGGGPGISPAFIGGAASILWHENVLARVSAGSAAAPAIPASSWPTKTFHQPRKYMYLNGEGIEVLHQPSAHSDGDAFVFFRRSDVVVAGDVLDTTRFPVIDVARGGGIDGERGAQSTRGPRHPVSADRVPRRGDPRDSWPRPRLRSAGRHRVPRHGDHHPRPCARLDSRRRVARPGQGGRSRPRLHAPLWLRHRPVDDHGLRRGGVSQPGADEAMSIGRLLTAAVIGLAVTADLSMAQAAAAGRHPAHGPQRRSTSPATGWPSSPRTGSTA